MDAQLRCPHRKLLQSSAWTEQSRWHPLDGLKQTWHWDSWHKQSRDNWPRRQSWLHSLGELGRCARERFGERRQYCPHLLGQRVLPWHAVARRRRLHALPVMRLCRVILRRSVCLVPPRRADPPLEDSANKFSRGIVTSNV